MARVVLDAISKTFDKRSGECTGGSVTGRLMGQPVSFAFLIDDSGEHPTVISRAGADAIKSTIYLEARPRALLEGAKVSVDWDTCVRVGDESFDRHFLVEAVPGPIAPLILNTLIRRQLLDLHPTKLLIDKSQVLLTFSHSIQEPEVAIDAVKLVGEIARSIPQALALIFPPEKAYRSQAHDPAVTRSQWDKEMGRLRRTQAKRRRIEIVQRLARPAAWLAGICVFVALAVKC